MATFDYRARAQSGELVRGVMEAATPEDIAKKLRQSGLLPTSIKEKIGKIESVEVPFVHYFTRIKTGDLIIFNMQLSNLVDSGIPLMNSLQAITKLLANPRLKRIVGEVGDSVAAGSTLSDALERYPKVFTQLFVSMVRAGEAGGNLGQILLRYATYAEQQDELKKSIYNALYYPVILMLAGLGSVVYIVTQIIPKFIDIFSKANVSLPLPTQILYTSGQWMTQYWLLFIFMVGAFFAAVKAYLSTPMGRYRFDQLKLALPLVGPIYKHVILSRFCRTLATLLNSGVPLLQSLAIVQDVVGNQVYARLTKNISIEVEKGHRIVEPMEKSEAFPPDMLQMVSAGEEVGRLGEMLIRTANYYETTVKYGIKKLVTLIEPMFIVLLGGIVGILMASLMMPLFDMINTIKT